MFAFNFLCMWCSLNILYVLKCGQLDLMAQTNTCDDDIAAVLVWEYSSEFSSISHWISCSKLLCYIATLDPFECVSAYLNKRFGSVSHLQNKNHFIESPRVDCSIKCCWQIPNQTSSSFVWSVGRNISFRHRLLLNELVYFYHIKIALEIIWFNLRI